MALHAVFKGTPGYGNNAMSRVHLDSKMDIYALFHGIAIATTMPYV